MCVCVCVYVCGFALVCGCVWVCVGVCVFVGVCVCWWFCVCGCVGGWLCECVCVCVCFFNFFINIQHAPLQGNITCFEVKQLSVYMSYLQLCIVTSIYIITNVVLLT